MCPLTIRSWWEPGCWTNTCTRASTEARECNCRWHLVGYGSIGQSNSSGDKKNALNELFGLTAMRLWNTGLGIDARYSKFDSAFASGTYRTVSVTRDLGQRFRLDLMGGRYDYTSSLAQTSNSLFINAIFDADLGARLFVQSALYHPARRSFGLQPVDEYDRVPVR